MRRKNLPTPIIGMSEQGARGVNKDAVSGARIAFSLVVPAYNESDRIAPLLDSYLPACESRWGDRFELIVVVNGSTDDTATFVRRYQAKHACLKVIEELDPIGKGAAVMRGLAESRGDACGYVDADAATPVSAFFDLVDQLASGQMDGVIASRWIAGAIVSPRQPLRRRITSRLFNGFTRLLFGLRFRDTQCGAKVFSRRSVDYLLSGPGTITRWAFDVDLLVRLKYGGFHIVEVPTEWHDQVGSKLMITESSLEMLAALIRLRLVYSPFKPLVNLYSRYFVNGSDDVSLVQSLSMGVGGNLSNFLNYFYHLLVIIYLGTEGALNHYPLLVAMMWGVTIFSFPFLQELRVGRGTSWPGLRVLLEGVVMLFLSGLYAWALFWGAGGRVPVLVFFISMLLLNTLQRGLACVLAGGGAVRSMGLVTVVQSVMKIAGFAVVVALGGGIFDLMAALIVACGFSVLLGVVLVFVALKGRSVAGAMVGAGNHDFFSWGLQTSGGFLVFGDVLLAYLVLKPETASLYTVVSVTAKLIFFAPMSHGLLNRCGGARGGIALLNRESLGLVLLGVAGMLVSLTFLGLFLSDGYWDREVWLVGGLLAPANLLLFLMFAEIRHFVKNVGRSRGGSSAIMLVSVMYIVTTLQVKPPVVGLAGLVLLVAGIAAGFRLAANRLRIEP